MPDLHGWIEQQITETEDVARLISPGGYEPDTWRTEPTRSGSWVQVVAYSRTLGEPPEAAVRESAQPVALVASGRREHWHIARHDPAAVLRRCAADRRILERHRVDPTQGRDRLFATACEGCGTAGYCDDPVTENINDCPELRDLAYAHGITDGILTRLDRPEPPPREPHRAVLVQAYWDALVPRTPMRDVPAVLRGPRWKDTP